MEEDRKIKDIGEGDTTRRTIWALPHSRIRGPSVVYTALYLYRIVTNGITRRKENAILQVIQYVQTRVGLGSRDAPTETQ